MYYLEDVHIEGFKSFSERTSMSFQPGIGVIIGNNGVGKSNILDAIVWALGEEDLSWVRCQGMEELFFFGSKDYPPATRIRVELTIKKTDDKQAPGLKLIREMTPKGGSHYRVQTKTLPLENYRAYLEDLGLKNSLKTIIRQEQINDMILMGPAQRFDQIRTLLPMGSTASLTGCLHDAIDPLFRQYLGLLMPLGAGRLKSVSQNGKNGLEIEVTLPGNRVRSAHQLSGGEKSVVSLALKLAIFNQLESPFYLLDEVEPSLDYTNHKSMQTLLKTVSGNKQLIMITHLRSTIELANTLHGVRTRWDGSSFMKFYFVMDERLLRLYKCC